MVKGGGQIHSDVRSPEAREPVAMGVTPAATNMEPWRLATVRDIWGLLWVQSVWQWPSGRAQGRKSPRIGVVSKEIGGLLHWRSGPASFSSLISYASPFSLAPSPSESPAPQTFLLLQQATCVSPLTNGMEPTSLLCREGPPSFCLSQLFPHSTPFPCFCPRP